MRYTYCAAILFGVLVHLTMAAPPETMTVDEAFSQLATYDYGQSEKPLRVIELHVVRSATDAAHRTSMAKRLAAILADGKTTPAAKVFLCQQLLVVGDEAQVPLVKKMLDDPQTAEMARYTLEALPGEAALEAIRETMERLPVPAKLGAINSLGIRRDAKSADSLAKLLDHSDPAVVAAAAEALGKIASSRHTPCAVRPGLESSRHTPCAVRPVAATALHNAQLQCAERLAAAGQKSLAAEIYLKIWTSNRPSAQRVGGLVGLANVAPDKATPAIVEMLSSKDPLLLATALRLALASKDIDAIRAAKTQLAKLDTSGKVLFLNALAEYREMSGVKDIEKFADDPDEMVRIAAIGVLGASADAAAVRPLLELATTKTGAVQQAARAALARLDGARCEGLLSDPARDKASKLRVEAIRALGARRCTEAISMLLEAAADSDPQVRAVALEALGAVVEADKFPSLVQLLAKSDAADASAAERAVLAAGDRLGDALDRAASVVAALENPATRTKPSLLRVLGGFGGEAALKAVRARLADAAAEVRDAAVRSLAGWPDAAAAAELLKVAQSAETNTHRVLALRGYLRLAGEEKNQAARLKLLEQVRPIATTVAARRMLLAALADAADPGALHVAASMLDDADVRAEAAAAVLKIARTVLKNDPPAVRAAMKRIMDTTSDKALADQAAALDDEALKAPSPQAAQQALRYDKKRSDQQKALLAKRAPQGYHLAGYLNCGPDQVDGARGKPMLRLVAGTPYSFVAAAPAAELRLSTVFFDGQKVVFEASGLDARRSYQVGFTWWDVDHDTRAQSVWAASGNAGSEIRLLEKTRLPSGAGGEKAAEKTIAVPKALTDGGRLQIVFRNESQPNVVVSEVWLWESDGEK